MKNIKVLGAIAAVLLLALAAYFGWNSLSHERPPLIGSDPFLNSGATSGFTRPLPQWVKLDAEKVALGNKLFHDTRLSGDNTVACASCHALTRGGVDGRPHSIGIHGAEGGINAPTVLNSGFNFVQFWDGRAATLEEQVNGPVTNDKEMGSTWPQVIEKLKQDENYVTQFAQIYSTPPSPEAVRDAIATFERSLITPNSPFDRYLRGDGAAMSASAQRGYQLFQSYGCIACHQGMNLGGNMYQTMGVMDNYFADRGHPTEADLGRYNVTHLDDDKHKFRVPSLRNVALTAPYFHDGSANTLQQAVTVMAKYQLGRSVPERDMTDLVAFLESLTGKLGGNTP